MSTGMAEPRLRRSAGEPGKLISKDEGIVDRTRWTCRPFILIVLSLCVIASLSLNYHLIGTRNYRVVMGETVKSINIDTGEDEIIQRFPGFFKTDTEMKELTDILNEASPDKESTSAGPLPHHHGCCETVGRLWAPQEGYNVLGEKKTIVQFEKRKQHYYFEKTKQKDVCLCPCKCVSHPIWVSAVYVDDKRGLDVQMFNLSYVFKCLT